MLESNPFPRLNHMTSSGKIMIMLQVRKKANIRHEFIFLRLLYNGLVQLELCHCM